MRAVVALAVLVPMLASAKVALPPPVIRPPDLRADEKPIAVAKSEKVLEENVFFQRVSVELVFSNANARVMGGELELPLPDDAAVCGYRLEIKGEMVPGVVCEKEHARVAFENEIRKGVDPGIVEQVKGNLWKTRIFPLNPNVPRKAIVEYIAPIEDKTALDGVVYELDGEWLYTAAFIKRKSLALEGIVRTFGKGTILWDASLSRLGKTDADRKRIAENLPEMGEWRFVSFSNVPGAPKACKTRDEVLAAIDAVVYDGGTDIAAALATVDLGRERPLIFTDEIDTLGGKDDDIDWSRVKLGTRIRFQHHDVTVTRRKWSEVGAWGGPTPKQSTLLATVWASRRMQDLALQADEHKDEFLALGRQYGVAGPGMSLIVLETLEQWLEHKIEPPTNLSFHAEWVKRRAAEDDPIAAKRERADFEKRLLELWEERVKWWNDPRPKKVTPSSGLFDEQVAASEATGNGYLTTGANSALREAPAPAPAMAMAASEADGAVEIDAAGGDAGLGGVAARKMKAPGAAGSDAKPSVTLKPWDPKTPYLDAIKSAPKGEAYATYLKQREAYKDSPAFYLDCAGWFFKQGETNTALRVISNLAEFKLEDAALWRTMGWRLREAGAYDESVRAFRHVLEMRGEEGQSRRDLALVLTERGKRNNGAKDLEEAMRLLCETAFTNHARRATRRSNDIQVSVFALEELNGLVAWCAANKAKVGEVKVPEFDAAYRRDLPVKLRIVMSWDADATDIDLHVLEPNGEEAFYRNRRTAEGGFVSEDVTTGYGPEEYLKKDLEAGAYKVLTNYFAPPQAMLTGATTVAATVYTDWATEKEAMQVLTLRLDKPREKCLIGEVKLGE